MQVTRSDNPAQQVRFGIRGRWLLIDLATLVLGGVAAVALQVWFLRPPWLYDPTDYFGLASAIPDAFLHHRTLRIGLVIPVRLAIDIFGYSEAAFYAIPTLSLVGLGVATYALGRVWFGRLVGLASGALIVANPYMLMWSAQIFPDIPAAATFTGAIAVLAAVGQRLRRGETLTGRNFALLGLAGLLLGWSYLIREFILILFPLVALVLAAYRMPWRAWLAVAISAFVMLGVELAWGWAVYGDPLTRIRFVMDGTPNTSELAQEVLESRAATRGSTVDRALVFSRLLLRHGVGVGFLGLSGLLFAGALVRRSRELALAAAWVLLYWLVLSGLYIYEDALGRVRLRVTLLRYWYPIFPPLIVGGLGGLVSLSRALRRSPRTHRVVSAVMVTGVAVPMVMFGLVAAARTEGLVRNGADHLIELRQWIAVNGGDTDVIWTDQRTRWSVEMSTRSTWGTELWVGSVRPFNTARRFVSEKRLQGGFVVLHDDFFRTRLSGWRGATPSWLVAAPLDWTLAFISSNNEIAVYNMGGEPKETEILSIGAFDERAWTVMSGENRELGDVQRLEGTGPHSFEIEAGHELVLTDSSGPRLDAPPDQSVPAGSYIRNRVDLVFEGDGWVDFVCLFFPASGGTRRVVGITLYHPAGDATLVEFVCRAPDTPGDRMGFRPALVASGPARVLVDNLTAYLVDPAR